jgi:hypothetical protein
MDPLETMWISNVARDKGAALPSTHAISRRDTSLPAFAAPDEAAVQDQVRQLAACCAMTCSLLPKDHEAMNNFPLPLGVIVSPLASKAFVAVRDTCPLCSECGAAATSFCCVNSGIFFFFFLFSFFFFSFSTRNSMDLFLLWC